MKTKYIIVLGLGLLCSKSNLMPMVHKKPSDLDRILTEKKDELDQLIQNGSNDIRVEWLAGYRLYSDPKRLAVMDGIVDLIRENNLDRIDLSNMTMHKLSSSSGDTLKHRVLFVHDHSTSDLKEKHNLFSHQDAEQLIKLAEYIDLSRSNLFVCENGKITLKKIQAINPFPYRYYSRDRQGRREHIIERKHLNDEQIRQLHKLEGLKQLLYNDFAKPVEEHLLNLYGRSQMFILLYLPEGDSRLVANE